MTIVAGVVLIALADGAPAKWASAVFTLTSMLLFGISALYHRFNWQPKTKVLLKRIDHANIFLLIAGTYTPLSILALPPDKGWLLLAIVWGGALLGIGFRVFWISAPRWLYVPIYLLLGWAAVMYLGDLLAASVAMMVLVIVGGLLYTGRRDRLRPEEAEPVAGAVRVPRDLPHLHGARVHVPLGGDAHHRDQPGLPRRLRPGEPPRSAGGRAVFVVGCRGRAVLRRGARAIRCRSVVDGGQPLLELFGLELRAHLGAVVDPADAPHHVEHEEHDDHHHEERERRTPRRPA